MPRGRRWSGWAEVGEEDRTQTIAPRARVPGQTGGRVAGQALSHRSGRPALSSVQGLRAGAGGGEEGGEQRPRQGGVHPAGARGTRWILLGGTPSVRRGAPSWARRILWSAGLQPRDAGSPLGRGWMSLLDLGGSSGRGSVCWKKGTLWGGAPHQGAQPGWRSPGILRARRAPGMRGGV